MKIGLCKSRHEIDGVVEYLFPNSVNPLDLSGLEETAFIAISKMEIGKSIDLYVTGLTVALVAALNVCRREGIAVTLYHFNRESGEYYPQIVQ